MGGGMNGEKPFEKIDPVKEPAKEPKRWELSKDGLELIKEFEGCSLKSYQDAVGVWTIGYGKIVYADGSRVQEGQLCTKEQAERWLLEDVEKEGAHFVRLWAPIENQNQFDALCSFTFNRGAGRLRELLATQDILNHIRDYDWAGKDKKYLEGLARRRAAEWLFFQGKPYSELMTIEGWRAWKEKNPK